MMSEPKWGKSDSKCHQANVLPTFKNSLKIAGKEYSEVFEVIEYEYDIHFLQNSK